MLRPGLTPWPAGAAPAAVPATAVASRRGAFAGSPRGGARNLEASAALRHSLRPRPSARPAAAAAPPRSLAACVAGAGVAAAAGGGRRGRRRQRRAAGGGGDGGLRVLLLGGAGRIGTAAAVHLLRRAPCRLELLLAGRDEARGQAAVEEVHGETAGLDGPNSGPQLSFHTLDWTAPGALRAFLERHQPHAVLHTAGPFDGDLGAEVLQAAISAEVPAYVDVADPVAYLDAAKAMSGEAQKAGTMALVSAGAFPGLSNVLAVECARRLGSSSQGTDGQDLQVQDLDFAYFTAGLGGSGPVNLLITNLGFGEPVPVYRQGAYSPQMIAGSEPRNVKFYVDEEDPAFEAVGEREVWAWPFPEAATVSRHLRIAGDSSTGMGTAPGIWNTILVALVSLVPRSLWRERWFSEGLAWFSLPMVWLTDRFVSETHAMRVRAAGPDGRECVAVQAHESFRRCVAQSSAEFLLELLERRQRPEEEDAWRPGVWLPEELADDDARRPQLLRRLTSTEGTISCNFRVS